MDRSDDTSGDVSGEGQWLTYAELAKYRGIDRTSAVRLAIRRHWRRQKGNTGREVRVLVPPEALTSDASMAVSGDASEHTSVDISSIVSGFEAALSVLREQLERSDQRADRAELATTELRGQIEALQAKLTAAEAGRGQAETDARELRAHEAALQLQLAQTTAAAQGAEELRQADAARKARGLLARLRAAVRGE